MRVVQTILILLALMFSSLAWAGVNVNTASQSELETLPGIGPAKARAIIEYREANGAFASVRELDAVPGIGPATLQGMRAQVEFGEAAAGPGRAPQAAVSAVEAAPAEPAAPAPGIAPAPVVAAPAPAVTPASSGPGLNINTASASQLESLPGIGPSKANAIVDDREANGPFGSCSELTRVTGVGNATVANIGAMCTTQ